MNNSKMNDLYKALRSLHDQQESGRVSVLFKFKENNGACTIMVHAGQIINIRPMIDLNQLHSANMQIKRVLLTASDSMAKHEVSPKAPKMADVLRGFRAGTKARRGATTSSNEQLADAMQLQKQVNEIFAELVGKDSVAQINKIAAKFSPASQPIQFLDECKSLIEITLNQAIADEIFKPIYNNVRHTK